MNTKDSIHILKKRLDNPYTSDEHRMDILQLFKKTIVWEEGRDIMGWFKEMKELVEYEE